MTDLIRDWGNGSGVGALLKPTAWTLNGANLGAHPAELPRARAVVHVVDIEDGVRLLLARWLSDAGIEAQTYAHLGAFLSTHRAEAPGCLVIDVQPLATGGFDPRAIPSPHTVCCPVVVTAHQPDVATAVRAMKAGVIDFVEKPLCEREIVAAVCAAIDFDRHQRLVASRYTALHARFATLTARERQVMVLVTAGLLNKQVGADLGLSEITIKAYRGAVMRKMGARSLADLVRMADVIGERLALPARGGWSTPARSVADADRRSGCTLVR